MLSLLNTNEGGHFDAVANVLASVESFVANLDDEVHVALLWVELFHELPGSLDGSARGEEVVVDEDHVVLVDGVLVDFDGVGAILLLEVLADGLCRQLSWLAAHHESCTEAASKDGAHDEPTRLDADHLGDALVLVKLIELVVHNLDALGILEESRDIAEVDALLWEVFDTTKMLHQIFVIHFLMRLIICFGFFF